MAAQQRWRQPIMWKQRGQCQLSAQPLAAEAASLIKVKT
jgi:hypothetical protein